MTPGSCASCRFFAPDDPDDEHGWGVCDKANDHEEVDYARFYVSGGGELLVTADFGCKDWEAEDAE